MYFKVEEREKMGKKKHHWSSTVYRETACTLPP
jgi:hypothetical protein